MLVVEELHVKRGEMEEVGAEGDEPHVERDTEEDDGQRDSQHTELQHSPRTFVFVAPGGPGHLVPLKLVHAVLVSVSRLSPGLTLTAI